MFFSSLVKCRCALARVSALFLVIALCLICRNSPAEIAVLPEPYYTNGIISVEAWCDIHTVTNVFLSYQDWQRYRLSINEACDYLRLEIIDIDYEIQDLYIYLGDLQTAFQDNICGFYLEMYDSGIISNSSLNAFEELFWQYLDPQNFESYIDTCNLTLQTMSDTLSFVSSDLDSITNNLAQIENDFWPQEVLQSVEVGMEPYDGPAGGGCHCPDYRSYLTYLQGQLADISSRVASIENELQRFLDGFATEALSEFGDSAYPATTIGSWLATFLGSLQAVYYRDYEHLNIVSTNVLAHILDGWVYPTNRVDDPLFVSIVDDNLESTLQSIFADLEVTVKQGTNLWNVVVTNQVLVSVTNSLENINDIDVEQTVDDLGGKLDELGQPEEITEEPIDYSTVFEDYKDAAVDLGQSWQSLFSTAVTDTDEMPTSIRLWSGYQPEGTHFDSLVIIPTTYWTISGSVASVCRSIRSVCRFLWLIVEIAIIARLFKINIFLVYQGIIVLFATASALGCPGLQKISWGEALNNIATSFRNNVDMFFPAPEDT